MDFQREGIWQGWQQYKKSKKVWKVVPIVVGALGATARLDEYMSMLDIEEKGDRQSRVICPLR